MFYFVLFLDPHAADANEHTVDSCSLLCLENSVVLMLAASFHSEIFTPQNLEGRSAKILADIKPVRVSKKVGDRCCEVNKIYRVYLPPCQLLLHWECFELVSS